jgi:phosphoglycerate dehydrogenase-like enzyme
MRIAILDDYQNVAGDFADWSRLPATETLTIFTDHLADEEALAARLAPFEILCVMRERTPLPARLIQRLPQLKLIVTTGMRNASIDIPAAHDQGVLVCGTASPGHATAELTFGLILSLARGIPQEFQSVRQNGWQTAVGRDLKGATLGIIGLGRLGAAVAHYATAFGMTVIAWSQNLTAERAAEVGVEMVGKERLLAQSDFVTIHLRLSDRTRGLIGPEEFARMKTDAYLVNTSRGPIIDRVALSNALARGTIAGAAIDVYDQEPLPKDHPFRGLPGLIATPHIGYVTRETYEIFYQETLEAVLAFLKGAPIRVIEP